MTNDIIDKILAMPMEQRLVIIRDVCEKSIPHDFCYGYMADWFEKKANQFDVKIKKINNVGKNKKL